MAKIQQQVSVNFMGNIHGCRAVLPVMKKQGSGKIVNVASLGGIVPMPGEAVYSATKAATAILEAVKGKRPERLVPSGTGVLARTDMAFPRVYFLLVPALKRIGSKNTSRRRKKEARP